MDDFSLDPWSVLRQLAYDRDEADECESDIVFDVMAGSRAQFTVIKVEMHESRNLKRLRQVLEATRTGNFSADWCLGVIDDIKSESGFDSDQSEPAKQAANSIPRQIRPIYSRMATGAVIMVAGLQRMERGVKDSDLTIVEAGLRQVESGLQQVDEAQNLALASAGEE